MKFERSFPRTILRSSDLDSIVANAMGLTSRQAEELVGEEVLCRRAVPVAGGCKFEVSIRAHSGSRRPNARTNLFGPGRWPGRLKGVRCASSS